MTPPRHMRALAAGWRRIEAAPRRQHRRGLAMREIGEPLMVHS